MLELGPGDAQLAALGLDRGQLGLRLEDVGAVHHPGLVARLAELEEPLGDPDAAVEQELPPFHTAQLEVGLDQRRLDGKPQGGLVGDAGGEALLAQLDRARDPAPEVDLPARVGTKRIAGPGAVVASGVGARDARRGAHAGPETRALGGKDGARLPDPGGGRADVLVVLRDASRQGIEPGIAEGAPPFVGRGQLQRLRRHHRQLRGMAERPRRFAGSRRRGIGDRAARQRDGREAEEKGKGSHHPGFVMIRGSRPA